MVWSAKGSEEQQQGCGGSDGWWIEQERDIHASNVRREQLGRTAKKKRLKGKSGASEFGNKKWKIQSGQIWTLLLRNPRMLELGERDGSN